MRDFQVADAKDFGSKLTGSLHLDGTDDAPALSGKVTTENAYFYLTAANSEGAVADVELTTEDLEVVERRFGSLASRVRKPGLFEATALDLGVTLGPNNWIRRRSDPVVSVELDGALAIKKESGGKLDIRGDVRALPGRSFVELVGRRFDLTRGGAQLNGPVETAHLDLGAEYRVATRGQSREPDVTITADVAADTGSIAVTLGSRPSMEQRDIMSYLLTGAPATTDPTLQSGSNTDYLATGTSLAVGAALGSIAGSAGQELGFDVVQILQDLQGAQTLVAGKYVSPRLYVGFRQPLSQSVSQDNDTESVGDVMEFEVEYAAFRKVLLNLQGAGSEFRVFLRLRAGD
jgi:autotransporter translocation and assembly factor TamB